MTAPADRWPAQPVTLLCPVCDGVHVVTRTDTAPGPDGHRITARMAVERAHDRDQAKGRAA